MPRFFVKPDQIQNEWVIITGNDVNHMKNVLRMSPGDTLSVSDGAGTDYFCIIEAMDKDEVRLHIENSWESYKELKSRLYLFQGLPKGDKLELIIQKAVELGVYEIIPMITRRTIVKLDDSKLTKKLNRWQNIAESAAKQSGRGIIPKIKKPMDFTEALSYSHSLECNLIPYERAEGVEASRKLIKSAANKGCIGIFIGPEGGFDAAEIELAIKAGIEPMTLGRRILRTETAGLAVLSVLMFQLD